jgi:sugar lactone lactonase YvrE
MMQTISTSLRICRLFSLHSFVFLWIITLGLATTQCSFGQTGPPTIPIITTVAGDPTAVFSPNGVVSDASGNIYFSDATKGTVSRIAPNGTITLIAGNGNYYNSGDGGLATQAGLESPDGLTFDKSGNLYVSAGSSVRRITPSGIISTVAGNGNYGDGPDGASATATSLKYAQGITIDASGNLYVVDQYSHRVRKITPTGAIITVAGSGTSGPGGDGGQATKALLSYPSDVAVDAAGNLYIADLSNYRVRKVTPAGIISTIAGTGSCCNITEGGAAANSRIDAPYSLAIDASGNLFVGVSGSILRVTAAGIITTVAGNGVRGDGGDGGPAINARLGYPYSMNINSAGNLIFSDGNNFGIRQITPAGIISTIAGPVNYMGDGGPATKAFLFEPRGITIDANNLLNIADTKLRRIRRVAANGTISTIAGTGANGTTGNGGPALSAQFSQPFSVATDALGNLFVNDNLSQQIRRIAADGTVSLMAGGTTVGDGGLAVNAKLYVIRGIATDASNNLYLADFSDEKIRKINTAGIISTVAGNGRYPYSGDGVLATNTAVDPTDVTVDATGNIYIADDYNDRVRRVNPQGIINTIAGGGTGSFVNGAIAANGYIGTPSAVAVDAAGGLFVASDYGRLIRVNANGTMSELGGYGFNTAHNGNLVSLADFNSVADLVFDKTGALYILESSRVHKIIFSPLLAQASAQTVCVGTAVSLSASVAGLTGGGLIYTWRGASGLLGNGQTLNTVVATTGINSYSLVATDGKSNNYVNIVNINGIASPPRPTVTPTLLTCQNVVLPALTAQAITGATVLWNGNGLTNSATAPVPPTTTPSSLTYLVTQQLNGCISPSASVVVTVQSAPLAPNVGSALALCVGDSPQSLQATPAAGNTLRWYTTADRTGAFSGSVTIPTTQSLVQTYYATQIDAKHCESSASSVSVRVRPKPSAVLTGQAPFMQRFVNGVGIDSTAISVGFVGDGPFTVMLWDGRTLTTTQNPLPVYVRPTTTTVYALKTLNTAGCVGDLGNQFTLTVQLILATDPTTADPLVLTLSPNPATDLVRVEWVAPAKETVTLRVVSSTGAVNWQTQRQSTGRSYTDELNVSQWPSGVYVVEMQTQSGGNKAVRLLKP